MAGNRRSSVGCRREKIAVPGIALLIQQPLKYIHSSTHTRYADVYGRSRGLLLGSLFYLVIVGHGVLENRTTQCATEIREKKRVRRDADWRDGDGKRREKKEREKTRRESNGKMWRVE